MNIKKELIKVIKNKSVLYMVGVGGMCGLFFIILTFNMIGYSVKQKCGNAMSSYDGDCVEALIGFLEDERNDLLSRNSAIWALGQMGDKRALDTLTKYYVGYEKGTRGNLEQELSQYEIYKAINLIDGGVNITAPFWRFGVGVE